MKLQLAVFALALVVPITANAACVPSDLKGGWQLYIAYRTEPWMHCRLTIKTDRSVHVSNCSRPPASLIITDDWRLATDNACQVTGRFSRVFDTGPHRLVGTLSTDANVAGGVGTYTEGRTFTFTMLRDKD